VPSDKHHRGGTDLKEIPGSQTHVSLTKPLVTFGVYVSLCDRQVDIIDAVLNSNREPNHAKLAHNAHLMGGLT
jgi:hypothetical protein